MVNKVLIGYVIGAAMGSLGTYICVKDHYKKVADKEIKSVKENILERTKAVYSVVEPKCKTDRVFDENYISEEKEEIRAKGEPKDYTSFYKGGGEVEVVLNTLAESEHPTDDKPTSKKKKKNPRIIKGEEFDSGSEYRKLTVYYYIGDGVVADEEDETELEDLTGKKLGSYRDLVGNCIGKYGFDSNDETVIYVRNENIMVDFEIMKDFGSYEDLHRED